MKNIIISVLLILCLNLAGQERYSDIDGQKFRFKEYWVGNITVIFESGMSDGLEAWGSLPSMVSASRSEWYKYHKKMVTGLKNARVIELDGGHYIQRNHPDLIISYIKELTSLSLSHGEKPVNQIPKWNHYILLLFAIHNLDFWSSYSGHVKTPDSVLFSKIDIAWVIVVLLLPFYLFVVIFIFSVTALYKF